MRYPPAAANWVAPIAQPSTLETDMLPYIGQLNPSDNRRFMRQHGRMLSGLGDMDVPSVSTVDPTQAAYTVRPMDQHTVEDASGEIQYCEEEDDVEGSSGIFDGMSRRPNINPNMGVFSANYNVPGFISREKLFSPNKSLFDSPNGGDVVVIPGGGGLYIDPSSIEGEFSQPFGPPEFRQAAPPSSFQPPANWWPTECPPTTQGPTLTNPYAPPATLLEPEPMYQPMFPEQGPTAHAQPLLPEEGPVMGGRPSRPRRPVRDGEPVVKGQEARPVQQGEPLVKGQVMRPVAQPRYQVAAAAPASYSFGPAAQPAVMARPQRYPSRPAPQTTERVRLSSALVSSGSSRRQKLAGLGGDGDGPSTVTVVLAGAVVGAGLAMIYKAIKG